MIKEAYCSFEVSKLLKEKGFNVHCDKGWDTNLYGVKQSRNFSINFDDKKTWIPDPTHQMAMAWLREAYNIHIGINPISEKGYNATIYDVADFDDCGIISDTESFFHAEEAVEAALKYCLESLI